MSMSQILICNKEKSWCGNVKEFPYTVEIVDIHGIANSLEL